MSTEELSNLTGQEILLSQEKLDEITGQPRKAGIWEQLAEYDRPITYNHLSLPHIRKWNWHSRLQVAKARKMVSRLKKLKLTPVHRVWCNYGSWKAEKEWMAKREAMLSPFLSGQPDPCGPVHMSATEYFERVAGTGWRLIDSPDIDPRVQAISNEVVYRKMMEIAKKTELDLWDKGSPATIQPEPLTVESLRKIVDDVSAAHPEQPERGLELRAGPETLEYFRNLMLNQVGISKERLGRVQVYGTAGALDNNALDSYRLLFYEPESYSVIPYKPEWKNQAEFFRPGYHSDENGTIKTDNHDNKEQD